MTEEVIKKLEADAEEAWQRFEENYDEENESYEEGFGNGIMYALNKIGIVKYCSTCHLKQSRGRLVCEKCGGEIHEGLNIE
jgi:hypothetical protein